MASSVSVARASVTASALPGHACSGRGRLLIPSHSSLARLRAPGVRPWEQQQRGIGSRTRRGSVRLSPVSALPLDAVSALPLDLHSTMLAFVSAELPQGINYTTEFNDFKLSQEAIKAFYMVFSCVFCWGAVVFGSMNDAYYESDEYRNAGGNGTQFWMYEKAEEEEENAREELWREELRHEIEEKMGEIKELQAGEEEVVKEVV